MNVGKQKSVKYKRSVNKSRLNIKGGKKSRLNIKGR